MEHKPGSVLEHHHQESFNDLLAAQLRRSPWFLISLGVHAIIILILYQVPWGSAKNAEDKGLQATVETPPEEEIIEEEPPPPEEEVEPVEEIIEEPTIVEQDVEEVLEDPFESPIESPFEAKNVNDIIGIGGGAGGRRGGGKYGRRARRGGTSATEKAVNDGLEWLARHQSPDGRWDCDGFSDLCKEMPYCSGPGNPLHDLGVTGLALLAFLGAGNTPVSGKPEYREVVRKGLRYIQSTQDERSGMFGQKVGQHYMYNHALAALAMTEGYGMWGNPVLKRTAQGGVNFVIAARNPYKAWRYDYPATGDNDSSVTGWMVMVLKSAEDFGLTVDKAAFDGALAFIDEVTDPETGRTGYQERGGFPAREPGMDEKYPRDKSESLTAVALLARIFMGQTPETEPMIARGAQLCATKPPVWDPEGGTNDLYYWYYGSYALYQLGGREWEAWNKAMKDAILPNQRQEGEQKGSWDPEGPWCNQGGRVYSTALMVLSLEVYYRYGHVIGARFQESK